MVKLLRWCTRVGGILALILGGMIGHVSFTWLVRAHMTLGMIVAAALLLIAISGFIARLRPVLPLIALLWAFAVVYVGIAQTRLMTSDSHWIIEVVHALLGIGAIGLAEAIGARISRRRA